MLYLGFKQLVFAFHSFVTCAIPDDKDAEFIICRCL